MEKSQVPLSKIALAVFLVALAGSSAYYLLYKTPNKKNTPSQKQDTVGHLSQTTVAKDTTQSQLLSPVTKPDTTKALASNPVTKRKHKKKTTVISIPVRAPDPVPHPTEAIHRIEAKVRLKKPQTPSQVPDYIPLVYWACREIGPINPDRGLEWVAEGLNYNEDGAFYAYGALLHFRKGRKTQAKSFAEEGRRNPSRLDPKASTLASAILTLLVDSTNVPAQAIARSYP
jgi:hypothetical protein